MKFPKPTTIHVKLKARALVDIHPDIVEVIEDSISESTEPRWLKLNRFDDTRTDIDTLPIFQEPTVPYRIEEVERWWPEGSDEGDLT